MAPLLEKKRYRSCLDCDYLEDVGENEGMCSFSVKIPASCIGAAEGYKQRVNLLDPFDYCDCWKERRE